MTELKSETQALLDLGRAGDDPGEDVIARNRQRLALKVGGAALGTAAVTGSATKALAASGSLKMLAICGAVAVAGVGLGGYALQRDVAPPSSKSAAVPSVAEPARQQQPPKPVEQNEPPAPEPLEVPIALGSLPSPATTSSGGSAKARAASIQSELELIRRAQKHLHRGEDAAALALLAEHARRFPNGVLTQERDASRVSALCQAGDVVAARALAEQFLQRSPQSPFADRVRNSCGKVGR